MKGLNKILFVVAFLFLFSASYGQLDKFFVGIGVMDFANPNFVSQADQAYNDPAVGLDALYLQSLADLNFNLIIPYNHLTQNGTQWVANSHPPSLGFLDRAHGLGIDVILVCPEVGFDSKNPLPSGVHSNVVGALNYYSNHPAVLGWSITDEPDLVDIWLISDYADTISKYYPQKIRYVNNYGIFHEPDDNLPKYTTAAIDRLSNGLNQLIDNAAINLVSTDAYPFRNIERNDSFYTRYFQELHALSKISNQKGIDYFHVFTAYGSNGGTILPLNFEEASYQIFSSLVYGSKGLFYWARERQNSGCKLHYYQNCNSAVDLGDNRWDTKLTSNTKEEISDLHKKLLEVGSVLFDLKYKGAYHFSEWSGRMDENGLDFEEPLFNDMLVSSPDTNQDDFFDNYITNKYFDLSAPIDQVTGSLDHIVISLMEDSKGDHYFWLFNKSLHDSKEIQVNFNNDYGIVDILDKEVYDFDDSHLIELNKAEGKLFQFSYFNVPYGNLCNASVSTSIRDIFGSNMTIAGPNCDVDYWSGADVEHYAIDFSIQENLHAHKGSHVVFRVYDPTPSHLRHGIFKNEVTEEKNSTSFDLYPNPATSKVTVRTIGEMFPRQVQILNHLGENQRTVYIRQADLDNGRFSIDIFNLVPGLYFVTVDFGHEKVTKKLVIQ